MRFFFASDRPFKKRVTWATFFMRELFKMCVFVDIRDRYFYIAILMSISHMCKKYPCYSHQMKTYLLNKTVSFRTHFIWQFRLALYANHSGAYALFPQTFVYILLSLK